MTTATPWKQQCPGYATYRWHEHGGIEFQGDGFLRYAHGTSQEAAILKFWTRYGPLLVRYALQFELPVSWVVGIVAIESAGDEWACSPCAPPYCGLKNCGGGVAKDGKHYVCCAYGLMQVIDSNVRHYGDMENGAQLLGNPEDSIRIGVKIFDEKLRQSKGDPIVAVRRYNGCKPCKGDQAPCVGEGIFGVGGQNNYCEKFALAVNTFLAANPKPVEPAPPGWQPSGLEGAETASSGALVPVLGLAGAAALSWWLSRRAGVI